MSYLEADHENAIVNANWNNFFWSSAAYFRL